MCRISIPSRTVEDRTFALAANIVKMISPEDFVERLCRLGADRGPRRFPRKQRDREILMKSIGMLLDSDRTYSESEINDALLEWNCNVAPAINSDHVTVRRLLVDYGHLERTADGEMYRVGFPPRPLAFDLDVDEIDIRATIAAYRDYAERKRRARTSNPAA
jgi:hypothetical protein